LTLASLTPGAVLDMALDSTAGLLGVSRLLHLREQVAKLPALGTTTADEQGIGDGVGESAS
jgi:hypothetical protein